MKHLILSAFSCLALAAVAAPAVTDVTFAEAANRDVTVTYSLADEPAVVTFDVTVDGVPLGGEHLRDLSGDVGRIVQPGAGRSLVWRPSRAGARALKGGAVQVAVRAWPTNDPPDYMSVNLLDGVAPGDRVRYYPTAASVPGGVLDPEYRTSHLLLRKIPAAGVAWTMGSTAAETRWDDTDVNREVPHAMRFPRNYYMGVFEVTRTQWFLVRGGADPLLNGTALQPMTAISFLDIRECGAGKNAPNDAYVYPNPPCPDSFIGQLRARTGVDLDLPSESWWEFAARATWGDATWPDGTDMNGTDVDANLGRLAAYKETAGTAPKPCGSFAPNDFGLYDTAGNVFEWCLDWGYTARHTRDDLADGGVQATLYSAGNPVHLLRGGAYDSPARVCRPARRAWALRETRGAGYGLRVACPADAK